MPHKEWEVYQRSRLVQIELKAVIDTSKEEGREEGREEGEIIKARKIAKEMKARGFAIDVIAEITNLSDEEIENL